MKAGKGDDIINEVVYNEETGGFGHWLHYDRINGTIDRLGEGETFVATYGEEENVDEAFFGEQGHDKIWVGGKVSGEARAYGGSGDDKIYGGYGVTGN